MGFQPCPEAALILPFCSNQPGSGQFFLLRVTFTSFLWDTLSPRGSSRSSECPRLLTVDLVDLRVGGEDLISQLLSGGKHLGVVGCNQILDQLLQLIPVHLEERL